MTRKRGLPPIIGANPRLLILGTLPGEESLRQQRYYAHPRNHFWPIIAALLKMSVPETDTECRALVIDNGIAVWDVLAAANREGSLDSALNDCTPNPIADLLKENPLIKTIAFNGQAAHTLFRRHIARNDPAHVKMIVLTSSSPTNTKPFETKLEAWRAALSENYSPLSRRKP